MRGYSVQNLGVRPCRSCLLVTAARTGKQIPLARRIQRVCDAAVAPLRTSSITLSNHGSLRGKVGGLETRSRQGVSSTESLTRGLLTGKPESASQQANTTRLGTAIAGRMSRPNCKGSASTDAHGVPSVRLVLSLLGSVMTDISVCLCYGLRGARIAMSPVASEWASIF